MCSQYEAKYEEDFIEDIKSAVVNKKWNIISTDLYDRSKYNLHHVNSNYIIKYTGIMVLMFLLMEWFDLQLTL